jgi:hypothetical protein
VEVQVLRDPRHFAKKSNCWLGEERLARNLIFNA